MAGKLFIVSASSGAGKTTLVNAVLQKIQPLYDISRVLTYTTRLPRQGEIDGIDYHFISKKEFEARIEQDFFLEWSNAYGAYYGSPSSILDDLPRGKSYIAILDRAGAQAVLNKFSEPILIWVHADLGSLHDRLAHRQTETSAQRDYRIQLAKKEIEEENVKKLYTFYIYNDDFNRAIAAIETLIISML